MRDNSSVIRTYEMEGLSEEKQLKIYQDIPENQDDLWEWEEKLSGKVQVVRPNREHFVWLNDRQAGIYREVKAKIYRQKLNRKRKEKKKQSI